MNRIYIPLTVFLLFAFFKLTAQTTAEERKIVKEWITANREQVNLISENEISKLSPAAKNLITKDLKTLIYNKEVTFNDIAAFEAKNLNSEKISPLAKLADKEKFKKEKAKSEKTAAEKQKDIRKSEKAEQEQQYIELMAAKAEQEEIDEWRMNNSTLKIISLQDYLNRTEIEKQEMIDNGLLVLEGEQLTMKDIRRFQNGQILPFR